MQRGITQFMQVVERGYLAIQESSKLCYTPRQCRERAKNAYWDFIKKMKWYGIVMVGHISKILVVLLTHV